MFVMSSVLKDVNDVCLSNFSAIGAPSSEPSGECRKCCFLFWLGVGISDARNVWRASKNGAAGKGEQRSTLSPSSGRVCPPPEKISTFDLFNHNF